MVGSNWPLCNSYTLVLEICSEDNMADWCKENMLQPVLAFTQVWLDWQIVHSNKGYLISPLGDTAWPDGLAYCSTICCQQSNTPYASYDFKTHNALTSSQFSTIQHDLPSNLGLEYAHLIQFPHIVLGKTTLSHPVVLLLQVKSLDLWITCLFISLFHQIWGHLERYNINYAIFMSYESTIFFYCKPQADIIYISKTHDISFMHHLTQSWHFSHSCCMQTWLLSLKRIGLNQRL
jgi:hypothetical protein